MSRIALIGASGEVGSRLLKELSDRGHTVTAIARHPEKIASLPNVTSVQGDVNDLDGLIALLKGHDVAISAVRFASSDPSKLITAVRAAGVPRYLVVGGAASLEVAPGQRLIDQPAFPDAYRTEALGGIAFLDQLRQEKELD
ncbi:MAG: NAD(P)H-binding protein, partial [Alcaligenes sp.]